MWLNYIHSNDPAPPGVFGGSICLCEDCIKKRTPKPEKTAIEIMQDAQLDQIPTTKNEVTS
jgi:hypothetical protein